MFGRLQKFTRFTSQNTIIVHSFANFSPFNLHFFLSSHSISLSQTVWAMCNFLSGYILNWNICSECCYHTQIQFKAKTDSRRTEPHWQEWTESILNKDISKIVDIRCGLKQYRIDTKTVPCHRIIKTVLDVYY